MQWEGLETSIRRPRWNIGTRPKSHVGLSSFCELHYSTFSSFKVGHWEPNSAQFKGRILWCWRIFLAVLVPLSQIHLQPLIAQPDAISIIQRLGYCSRTEALRMAQSELKSNSTALVFSQLSKWTGTIGRRRSYSGGLFSSFHVNEVEASEKLKLDTGRDPCLTAFPLRDSHQRTELWENERFAKH